MKHPLDAAPIDHIMWTAHRGFLVGADIRHHDGGAVIDLRAYFADKAAHAPAPLPAPWCAIGTASLIESPNLIEPRP